MTEVIIVGAAGRMGQCLTSLAKADPALDLVGAVDNGERLESLKALDCPVADKLAGIPALASGAAIIDFTAPEVSLGTARLAAENGNPLVIGTTGLGEGHFAELNELAAKTPIFWSSNMSIGVNVLAKILPLLARALGEDYDIELVELHHNRKKDSPSGTALTLGKCLAGARGWDLPDVAADGRSGLVGARPKAQIGFHAVRGGDVVGVHTVYFMGPGERIEVSHQAHSRENFAQGALRACVWLAGQKPGKLYSMADML